MIEERVGGNKVTYRPSGWGKCRYVGLRLSVPMCSSSLGWLDKSENPYHGVHRGARGGNFFELAEIDSGHLALALLHSPLRALP
jgi:hypothetical protein